MKKYNKETRIQTIKLSYEIGVKKASEQLDISFYTLTDWRRDRRRHYLLGETLIDTTHPSDLERKMFKELKELRESNQFLKDVLNFIIKDQKK